MAELADELPGFGGLYLDENQRMVIQLTNKGDLRLARTKVREYFMARARSEASRMAVRQQKIEEAISHSVKYDFRQLHTWYDEIRAKILSLNGVTSGDIDEARNRIVIGVADPEMMATVQKELAQVAAPEDAVLVKSGIRPAKLDVDLRDEVRPVVAGVQISRVGFCTLGYNVAHPEDSYWYFVTASHCTEVYGTVNSDVFGQPENDRPIGFEVADPPTFTLAEDPRCPSYECRFSDVALIRYTISSHKQGHIAWPTNFGSRNSTTTKPIDGAADPVLYQLVHMVGRTSGHQAGLVQGMCEDILGSDGIWRLCSGRADYVSGAGDSGAPVFTDGTWYGGMVIARGVHWGSQTATVKFFSLHSLWDSELREDFGGTFDVTAPPPPFTLSINGPSVVSPMAIACTWLAAASGGTPPYHSYQWSGVLSGTNLL